MMKFKHKAISLFLAVLLIVTNCPVVLPAVSAAESSIVIHLYSETPNPYIYYWNSLPENIVTDYPGVAMTADSEQGDNWYTYTFDGCTKINMLFTNSDCSQVTGTELTRTTGEWWYKNNEWKNYNPDGETPERSSHDFREDTIYSLMITRFYDGEESNNVHCWDDSRIGNHDDDPSWRGDFKGLIEKLDYIKALGFSAVMLNPVAQNASGYDYHGLHPVNLMEIDSRYESEGYTYEDLIEACHEKDLRVIQKVILNNTGSYGESNLCPLFEVNEEADASIKEERMVPTDNLLRTCKLNNKDEYWAQDALTQMNQRLHLMKNTDYSTDNMSSTGSLPAESDYDISKLSNSAIYNPLNYYHTGYFSNDESNDWRFQFSQKGDNSVDLNTENPYVGEYLARSIAMYARKGVDAVNINTVDGITRLSLDVNIIKPLKEMLAEENLDIEIFGDVASDSKSVWNGEQAILSAPFYTWNQSDADLTGRWSTGTSKEDISNNMNLAFDFIKKNNDVTNQPISDNAFLNGITYHTPDYEEKFLNMQDSPMMNNFVNAQSAFGIAKDGDKYYNDATWNMTMYQDVDSSYWGALRSQSGTEDKAEMLSLMFTFRGIPTVFYGDEVEFKKNEIISVDGLASLSNTGHAYYGDYLEGEVTATDFSEYTANGTVADTLSAPLSQHIMKLNLIRRAIPALQKGQYTTDSSYVSGNNLAFIRRYTDATVDSLALVTISGGATFKNIPNGTYIDAVTGDVQVVTNGTLSVGAIGKGNMRVYVCCASGFTGIDGRIGGTTTYLKSRYSTTVNTAAATTNTMALNSSGVEAYAAGDVIYCQNDANWGNVYCYMYNSTDPLNNRNAAWPGIKMEDLGNGLWKYEVGNDSFDKIIFNDSSTVNASDELSFNGNNGVYNNSTKEWSKYSPLVIKSLVTDLASPQYKQTDVVITATAETPSSTAITYKFSVDGTVIQDYSPNNICIWTPETPGTKNIKVEVKDEAGNTNEQTISYVIMDDSVEVRPILKGVSPKKGTCIELNKSTDITINATGGNTGTKLLFYKYIITDPDGKRINTPYYTLNPSFSFTPTAEGRYTVQVCVQGSDNTTVSRSLEYNSVEFLPNEEGIYEIQNASQLEWFANKVNKDNTSFGNAKAVLTNNIILNTGDIAGNNPANTEELSKWTPIGNSSNKFTGTFDGQGHTISGLYINSDSIDSVGLFGYVGDGGTVSNVGVVNSYFAGKDKVGSVCGYNEGIITGCYSIASINGDGNVGGVCGYNQGTITNCYYLAETETDSIEGTTFKTEADFKSGEVAYLLSQGCTIGETTYDGDVWGQTLGDAGDAYPVLKKTGDAGNTVYRNAIYEGCEGNKGEPVYSYSNTQEAPVYAEHTDADNDGKCDKCDRFIDGIGARLVGHSLTLDGSVGVNFYMELSSEVINDSSAYMEFTLPGGKTSTVNVSEALSEVISGKTYYKFRCQVNAAEMTDTISAQLISTVGNSKVYEYTVKEYADYLFAHKDDNAEFANAANLIEAMVNYGSYAQIYAGYNTENLAVGDKELKSVTDVTLDASKYTYTPNENEKKVQFAGANLSLLSTTTLRMYFSITDDVAESATFTYKGNILKKTKSGDYYYVELAGIPASELDENCVVTVDDGTTSFEVTYTPMAYCSNVINRVITGTRTDALKNLIKALVLYNQAADAYITGQQG